MEILYVDLIPKSFKDSAKGTLIFAMLMGAATQVANAAARYLNDKLADNQPLDISDQERNALERYTLYMRVCRDSDNLNMVS